MISKSFVGVLLIAFSLVMLPAASQAGAGPGYWGHGLGGYGGGFFGGYGSFGGYGGYGGYGYGLCAPYAGWQTPYFAWNPPVYYSSPVAYPYGYSPFPNLPYGLAAGGPGGNGSYAEQPAASPAHLPPLRIANPYVTKAEGGGGKAEGAE